MSFGSDCQLHIHKYYFIFFHFSSFHFFIILFILSTYGYAVIIHRNRKYQLRTKIIYRKRKCNRKRTARSVFEITYLWTLLLVLRNYQSSVPWLWRQSDSSLHPNEKRENSQRMKKQNQFYFNSFISIFVKLFSLFILCFWFFFCSLCLVSSEINSIRGRNCCNHRQNMYKRKYNKNKKEKKYKWNPVLDWLNWLDCSEWQKQWMNKNKIYKIDWIKNKK